MRMTLHRLELPLAHAFTISRGSIATQQSLVVELEHDGHRGFGEVTENTYYKHTLDSMSASLEGVREPLEAVIDDRPEQVWAAMSRLLQHDFFALSALDAAIHDIAAKRAGLPAWQAWGLTWTAVPASSFTIGIDSIDKMKSKLAEQPGWPIYKIKLGTEHDLEIVRGLREVTDTVFRVDANCGWTVDQAIEYSGALADLNVEFIEQPLPAEASTADKQRLYQQSALPIVADESCIGEGDVAGCRGLFHGVNVKLCKCGGLTPARRMLTEARSLGMKTMVGCMVESSVGISAAAHLLPLLDYADLDGASLLASDPARGVVIREGIVSQPQQPGIGAELSER